MNIYKRVTEGIHVTDFTHEECETIIEVLRAIQSLAYGNHGVTLCAEDKDTVYTFSSEKLCVSVAEDDSNLIYRVNINTGNEQILVLDVYADFVKPEFYDYIVWTFHDGWWVKELARLTADDDGIKERKDAFKPLTQLAFK